MIQFITLVGIVVALAAFLFVFKEIFSVEEKENSPYQRKKYLFDSNAEFALFNILLELFGDKYYVFPQINYSHVVEVKNMPRPMWQKYRNRIDRKSADFVLANKHTATPELIIELDGPSHRAESRQARDKFVDGLMNVAGLPIVHFDSSNLDKNVVREKIEKALTPGSENPFPVLG